MISVIEVTTDINQIYITDIQSLISSMRQCDLDKSKSIFKDLKPNKDNLFSYISCCEPATITRLDTSYNIRVMNDYGYYFEGKVIKNWELFTFETKGLYWTELPIDIMITSYQKLNGRYLVYVSR